MNISLRIKQIIICIGIFLPMHMLFAQTPSWSINSADYSLDASVIATIKIDGQLSTDTNDLLAAFDTNGVVRGVVNLSFSSTLNKHLAFLSIHSNVNGDELTFKVYDASQDKVFDANNSAITFEPNKIFGTNDTPFQVEAGSSLSIQNNFLKEFKIYPNPTTDKVYVKSKEALTQVTVFSVLGKKIIEKQTNKSEITLNFKNLKTGVYVLKVASNNKTITRKIIKR